MICPTADVFWYLVLGFATLSIRRWLFQDASDRCAADLDACADDVPRDGSRAEFPFRAEPPDLMHKPAHGIMEFVPRRFSYKPLCPSPPIERALPPANGVWMK